MPTQLVPLVTGELVGAIVLLALPFLLIYLLWRQFRRRRDKGIDGYF